MNIYYYCVIVVFLFTSTVMIYDENVVIYIDLLTKLISQKAFLLRWWLFNNPKNPVVSYFLWRKHVKMAKDLQEELFTKVNSTNK